MSKLPKVGEVVQLFGIGCEGCGHFRGQFEVCRVVDQEGEVFLVVDPQDIQCEGPVEKKAFTQLTIAWNRDLESWQTDCGEHQVAVHIAGHYHGPTREAA